MMPPLTRPDLTLSCEMSLHAHCSRPETCTCWCHGEENTDARRS